MNGEGLKGCGRGRATEGGGLRIGVAALFGFGCPCVGNCGVPVTTVPFFRGGVVTLDGTATAAIGAVVDVGMGEGVGTVVLICPGDGCCGGRFDVLVPFTIGVVLAALGVAAAAAAAAAPEGSEAGGTCCAGGCPCCCCACNQSKNASQQ